MSFHVARGGAQIGQFGEQAFRDKILVGEIRPDDHYWTEGLDDWQLVSEYPGLPSLAGPSTLPPLPRGMPMKKKARTETPAAIGGLCALVAAFAPLLSPTLFLLLSLPLLVAAFVLAIVSVVRGRVIGGICLLVGLLPALMMAFVTLTERDKLLTSQFATPTPTVEPTTAPPQFVTVAKPTSMANVTLAPGTLVELVSREGDYVYIRYGNRHYLIPADSIYERP